MIHAGIKRADDKWPRSYQKFSAKEPMPMIEDPEGQMIPEYATEEEHVSAVLERIYRRICGQGKKILKLAAPSEYDNDD